MNDNKTQSEMILETLKSGQTITPWEAMKYFGCMRLAARINELRRDGHLIGVRWKKSKGRFGNEIKFKEYFLDAEL